MSELTTTTFDLSPRSLEEALKFAEMLSKSTIVPKDFQGNPGNILVAVQWGMELGLKPLQAMQNIAVINGRPSLWGDSVIAIVRASPLCEYIYETEEGNTSICRVKRVGEDEQVRTFSDDDADEAGLLSKAGPWKQYKKRMRQMRARAFALRDVFPDVLKGMPIAEEISDYEEKDITPRSSSTVLKAVEETKEEIEQKITEEQAENLFNALQMAGITANEFCAHKSIKIEKIYDLPSHKYEGAMNFLKALAQNLVAQNENN